MAAKRSSALRVLQRKSATGAGRKANGEKRSAKVGLYLNRSDSVGYFAYRFAPASRWCEDARKISKFPDGRLASCCATVAGGCPASDRNASLTAGLDANALPAASAKAVTRYSAMRIRRRRGSGTAAKRAEVRCAASRGVEAVMDAPEGRTIGRESAYVLRTRGWRRCHSAAWVS